MWATAAMGFAATLIAIVLVFVPPPGTESVLTYQANIIGQSLVLVLIGVGFYAAARR